VIKIAPSILAADFRRLGEEVQQAEASGADWIHVDVMDGHSVPNITIGPFVVEAVRRVTRLPLDVHLMIEAPERYLQDFAGAGADHLTVHVETCPHLHRTLDRIHEIGLKAGIAIDPATPLVMLTEAIRQVDLVLLMTVEPGFGGQKFISRSLGRLRELREMLVSANVTPHVAVDGGIDKTTAPGVVNAGADVLIAGTSIFGSKDGIAVAIHNLRESIERAANETPAS